MKFPNQTSYEFLSENQGKLVEITNKFFLYEKKLNRFNEVELEEYCFIPAKTKIFILSTKLDHEYYICSFLGKNKLYYSYCCTKCYWNKNGHIFYYMEIVK